MIDIKLTQTNNNYYDFNFGDDGDFQTVDNFDTSILLSLYTDKRASSFEVPDSEKRKGYLADELYTDFTHGSKLWLLDQSRLNTNTRNLATTYTQDSLSWLVSDGYLNSIEVNTTTSNNTNINIIITAYAENDTNTWAYSLWKNTGDSN